MTTILSLNPEAVPSDGDVLVYDAVAQKWLPAAPATGGSGAVDSVNGQTGTVALDAADVGAATASHGHAVADVSGLQAALDGKQAAGSYATATHTHAASQVSDSTTTGRALLTAADAAAARTAIGAGTSSLALGTTSSTAKAGDYQPTWTQVTSKPSTFAPSAHTHPASELTATGTRDATTFLRGDNTWAVPAGGGGSDPWSYVVATVDTSDSTGSAVNVTGLTVSGLANGLYEIEARLLTTSAAFAAAPIPGVTWPASVALYASWETANAAGGSRTFTATTTSPSEPNATQHPASSGVVVQVNSLAGLARVASMTGSINITIRTETAATAVTVKADSFIRYRKIAD